MRIENGILMDVDESDLIQASTKKSIFRHLNRNREQKRTLVIPDGVISISENALKKIKEKINEIVLPEGLVSIEKNCFSNLVFLEKINMPSTLEDLGEGAFSGCEHLKEVDLSNTQIKEVKNKTFANCSDVNRIKLPNTVQKLGSNAFLNCYNLSEFQNSTSIKEIGNSAFSSCKALKKIELYDGLEKIGDDVFSGCITLKNLSLPNTLSHIGEGAFCDCTSFTDIKLPESLDTIENELFTGCINLSRVYIPESVTSIGEAAFKYCSSLKQAHLPNGLTSIENECFSGCSSLTRFDIPSNVTRIGNKAFQSCKRLNAIYIPEKVTEIGRMAFENCENLDRVVLPDGLKTISKAMFKNCHSLSDISVPKSVSAIEDDAFNNCYKMKAFYLSDNVNSLGEAVFKGCLSLTDVSLPNTLTSIPDYTFAECSKIRTITLPESVKSIGKKAFSSCSNLVKIDLPKKLESIGIGSFEKCRALRVANLSNTINSLGDSAFSGCSSLETVILPKNIKILESNLFKDCDSLYDVKLPAGLEIIDSFVFSNCKSLNEIKIPDSVYEIGEDAFSFCEDLSKFNFPKSLKTIGYGAFSNTKLSGQIVLPEGTESIGDYAFSGCENIEGYTLPEGIKSIGNFAFASSDIPEIFIPKGVEKMGDFSSSGFNFITRTDDGYLFSQEEPDGNVKTQRLRLSPAFISSHWERLETILKEQHNDRICEFYNVFLSSVPLKEAEEFIDSHNFTFFKQLPIQTDMEEDAFYIYKFLYNLGAVDKPVTNDKGKTIDYAQKITGFLIEQIKNKKFNFNLIPINFKEMNLTGIKPEFTEFYIANYEELMKIEGERPGFIAQCYNEFENVQKTNKSNRGDQRQLKATVQRFVDYFREISFLNVTDETKQIADTLKPFYTSQTSFEEAVQIERERIKRNTPNNILNIPLKEGDVFKTIDDYAEKIKILRIDTLKELSRISEKQFTFEWLEKNDPRAFVLGKFVDCCAQIEGNGYGIMRASIIEPNIQNLIIVNSENVIVAKSTLYVNMEEGYGVCNNVEIAKSVPQELYDLIYQKFILGIEAFAEEYNREHPYKPLRQINIGMNDKNDLRVQIAEHNVKTRNLLKAPDYSEYGVKYRNYMGDSSEKQHIIWQIERGENENGK